MEIARILGQLKCTVYTASIDKRRLIHEMTLETTLPLQMQVLAEHFAVECGVHNEVGMLVSDWSAHRLDAHASQHVARFVKSRGLPLHPNVYFADSLSTHAIQVADLIAGVHRRALEGDERGRIISSEFATIHSLPESVSLLTCEDRPFQRQVELFR